MIRKLFVAMVVYVASALGSAIGSAAAAQSPPPAAPSLWSFFGSAVAAEDSTDPAGWLRLTPNATSSVGMALSRQGEFDIRKGLTLSFLYASWGGGTPGGDGLSVFLFDPSKTMSGGEAGAGLGYCGAPGGWLAVGLDEYGNFSHPQNRCGSGPGNKPQSVVIRGPYANGSAYVAAASVPSGVDRPIAGDRSGAGEVALYLWPKTGGYTVALDWRAWGTVDWRPLVERADFPFTAPNLLGVGAAASTGAAKNVHEVARLRPRLHAGVGASMRFDPAGTAPDTPSTLTLEFGSGSRSASILVRAMTLQLPAGLHLANPPALGGTCAASLRAVADGDTITLEKGSVIRTGGCTVSASVVARAQGSYAATLPAGMLLTDAGTNLAPASAALTVSR